MEQGLNNANIAILGLHQDFSYMGGVMVDDIHPLDCHLKPLQTLEINYWGHDRQRFGSFVCRGPSHSHAGLGCSLN
jgi:hypothetical protein